MVKNTKGGRNAKKMGRKFTGSGTTNNKLRSANPNEECEIYACVNKLLGNGMAHVVDTKGTTLMLHIRNKFRGRGKRDNAINVGSVVLVGTRSFETKKEGKLTNCDLLEVYNSNEVKRLEEQTTTDFSSFKKIQNKLHHEANCDDDDGFEFATKSSNDLTIENQILKELETNNHDQNNDDLLANDEDLDFDIDDI